MEPMFIKSWNNQTITLVPTCLTGFPALQLNIEGHIRAGPGNLGYPGEGGWGLKKRRIHPNL